jgi:hypothetical protein
MVTDADFGYPAWRGYIEWVYRQLDAQKQFTADTGIAWPNKPATRFEAMIDKATGYADKHAEAFVLWASEQYGIQYCPPSVQEALSRHGAASAAGRATGAR